MSASKPAVCFHCGLPATGRAACLGEVKGRERAFCCGGCLSVCKVIHESGLDGFYDRVRQRESRLAPPPDMPTEMDQYDLVEVQQEFVQAGRGGAEALLLIEGIHCAACVWLIEKAMLDMAGVEKAEVNLAHKRLRIRWHNDEVKLSHIMHRLAAIGYAGVPFNQETMEGSVQQANRKLLFRMAFAGFGVLNIMWVSIALYAGAFSAGESGYANFFYWVSFAIATPVLFYSGGGFLLGAWRSLRFGRLSMDVPIAIGALATYSYSVWQVLQHHEHIYFDTVVTFLFVILIGRYLEALAKRNASSASMRLMELQPRMATRLLANGEEERIAVRKLSIGDAVLVRPGDKIPADGYIIEGESHIDESMLTGEVRLIHKRSGEHLSAGTVNGEGPLKLCVEATGGDTALARIIHLVETAQGSKARVQRLADQIVPWFVLATLLLAAVTFTYWLYVDTDTALLAAAAVLIITCPCALGLATPMAIAVAAGLGAKHGVLVRDGQSLEGLAGVNHIVFDKTGTLTEGKMRLEQVFCLGHLTDDKLIQLAASLEVNFSHPLARAFVDAAETRNQPLLDCHDAYAIEGAGVCGMVAGMTLAVGNARLFDALGIELEDSLLHQQGIKVDSAGAGLWLLFDGQIAGFFVVQDRLRSDAHHIVSWAREQGMGLTVLTGDSAAAASRLRETLGHVDVVAGLLPEEKAQQVKALRQQGKTVLMVGDGVNDAPALALADVSVAMGSGTDVSMECSDIVLMGSELSKIAFTVSLGIQTLRTIRQNLAVSLAYNILLVPLAMAAMVTPVFAAIAMPVSSLLVIGNAVLIRRRCRYIAPALSPSAFPPSA